MLSQRHFERIFPSTSGYRMLLVDTPNAEAAVETAELLNEVLIDEGSDDHTNEYKAR